MSQHAINMHINGEYEDTMYQQLKQHYHKGEFDELQDKLDLMSDPADAGDYAIYLQFVENHGTAPWYHSGN